MSDMIGGMDEGMSGEPKAPMTSGANSPAGTLRTYLEACRSRLRQRFLARGAAALTLGALALTGIFALLFVTLVPSSGWVLFARVLIWLALVASIGLLIWWPFSELAVARTVEATTPSWICNILLRYAPGVRFMGPSNYADAWQRLKDDVIANCA